MVEMSVPMLFPFVCITILGDTHFISLLEIKKLKFEEAKNLASQSKNMNPGSPSLHHA